MKNVKMKRSFDDEGVDHELSADFDDADIGLLTQFRQHVKALSETRVVKDGYPSKFEFGWRDETGSEVKGQNLDSEFISSFLHKLRPLILSREPESFDKVCGLIGRRFAHRAMKRHLTAIRKVYETSRFSSLGQLTIDGISTSIEILVKIELVNDV